MMFQRTLRISEGLARAFEDAGYATLEEIAYVPIDEINKSKKFPNGCSSIVRATCRKVSIHHRARRRRHTIRCLARAPHQVLARPMEAEDHQVSWSLYFADPHGNPFEITSYDYATLEPKQ